MRCDEEERQRAAPRESHRAGHAEGNSSHSQQDTCCLFFWCFSFFLEGAGSGTPRRRPAAAFPPAGGLRGGWVCAPGSPCAAPHSTPCAEEAGRRRGPTTMGLAGAINTRPHLYLVWPDHNRGGGGRGGVPKIAPRARPPPPPLNGLRPRPLPRARSRAPRAGPGGAKFSNAACVNDAAAVRQPRRAPPLGTGPAASCAWIGRGGGTRAVTWGRGLAPAGGRRRPEGKRSRAGSPAGSPAGGAGSGRAAAPEGGREPGTPRRPREDGAHRPGKGIPGSDVVAGPRRPASLAPAPALPPGEGARTAAVPAAGWWSERQSESAAAAAGPSSSGRRAPRPRRFPSVGRSRLAGSLCAKHKRGTGRHGCGDSREHPGCRRWM